MSQNDTDAMEASKLANDYAWSAHGCSQLDIRDAYRAGWRAHAERTKKLVQALDKIRNCMLDDKFEKFGADGMVAWVVSYADMALDEFNKSTHT